MPQVDKQVIVDGLALQPGVVRLQRRVLLALGQQVGAEFQQGLRRGGDLPQLLPGEIGPVLADAGQDFIEHPAFKPLRRGQLAVDDEAVHVAFGDKKHLYHLYGGGPIHLFAGLDPYAPFQGMGAMPVNGILRFGISQRLGNIYTTEQVLVILLNDADAAKLRVFENFHLVHIVPPWAVQQKSGRYQPPACISWLTWAV